ncbi:hypothetical protein FHG87_017852 [Trinorchestia longiramus]|nr:hypothetical protein FHG87_017852 [Trinorchestia longiramus]
MEAKRIEILALLRAPHKKSDMAKRLNVNRMAVHRVASRLRDGETLNDCPRLDEKTFSVDPLVNKQNDHIVSFDLIISELRNVFTTKHPASVMMLGLVVSNGEKMPPVWFPRYYRLNASAYKDVLVTKILLWALLFTLSTTERLEEAKPVPPWIRRASSNEQNKLSLRKIFWVETVSTAVFVENGSPTSAQKEERKKERKKLCFQ